MTNLKKLFAAVMATAMLATMSMGALADSLKPITDKVSYVEIESEEGFDFISPRTTKQIDTTVFSGRTALGTDVFSLDSGDSVHFNCSYLPSSAEIYFGVLYIPTNTVYYTTDDGDGNIDKSFSVPKGGKYKIALVNKSNQDVEIKGFVSY